MIIDDFAHALASWRVEIVATDLSQAALAKAGEATYSRFEVQRGLSKEQIQRYFQQDDEMWKLKDRIKSRVEFKHFNLLNGFESLGQFDVIFCRNVLIYFEAERKADILRRMTQLLTPDGLLVLGASESVIGLDVKLKTHPEYRGFYIAAK
jgi:chemotaxis protein methyltransferase CheR